MDWNLKKLANYFKIIPWVLEKSVKTDYTFFFLGKIISCFPPDVIEAVLSQIFDQVWPTYSRISVTVPRQAQKSFKSFVGHLHSTLLETGSFN